MHKLKIYYGSYFTVVKLNLSSFNYSGHYIKLIWSFLQVVYIFSAVILIQKQQYNINITRNNEILNQKVRCYTYQLISNLVV